MSSKKYANPLTLKPKLSRILVSLLVVGHIGAVGLLIPLVFPVEIKLILAAMFVVSLIVALQKQAGVSRAGNVATLVWKADGDWVIETVNGKSCKAQLQTSSYLHLWLVVLNFKSEENRHMRSVVLFPDALDAEVLRKLRVRLGVEGAEHTDS
jgi:hypothetical protein